MISDKELFSKNWVHPIRYKKILDRLYEDEWYDWDGDSLKVTLLKDGFGEIPWYVYNKIRALQALRLNNRCYTDFYVFEKVVTAFNEEHVQWDLIQAPEPEEMALTVKIILDIYPEAEFGAEIRKYIAAKSAEEGFVLLPPPIAFAQEELDKMNKFSIANDVKESVQTALGNAKKSGEVLKGDTLIGHAINKYLSVASYVKEKADG